MIVVEYLEYFVQETVCQQHAAALYLDGGNVILCSNGFHSAVRRKVGYGCTFGPMVQEC